MENCPRKWQENCPKRLTKAGCGLVLHHILYPAKTYNTQLEKTFRGLPANKVMMCKYVEEQIHDTQPEGPPKPSANTMEYCVELHELKTELAIRKR